MVWVTAAVAAAKMAGDYAKSQQAKRAARSNRAKEEHYYNMARKPWEDLTVPELEQLKLEQEQYAGDVSPELSKLAMGKSAMQDVTTDPRFQQAQLDALSRMSEMSEGGLSEADKNALLQTQQMQARDNQGQQEAILQSMAERGMGGAGNELAQKLQAQQSGADRSAMTGSQINADSSNRALQAMMQAGQLGGNMQGAQFSREAQKAQAADAAKKFDAGFLGQGMMRDKYTRQGLNTRNTDISNTATTYNTKELPLNQFNMGAEKAGAISDTFTQQAGGTLSDRSRQVKSSGAGEKALGDLAGKFIESKYGGSSK